MAFHLPFRSKTTRLSTRRVFANLSAVTAETWRPDFGPSAPHPSAGASAIGARRLLIAYNVNLETDDLAIAKRIARSVRASNGGLPAVKAIGVRTEQPDVVQVSINLVDYERTSLHRVFASVQREADRLFLHQLRGAPAAHAFQMHCARNTLQ